jgi:hypothetical protein
MQDRWKLAADVLAVGMGCHTELTIHVHGDGIGRWSLARLAICML